VIVSILVDSVLYNDDESCVRTVFALLAHQVQPSATPHHVRYTAGSLLHYLQLLCRRGLQASVVEQYLWTSLKARLLGRVQPGELASKRHAMNIIQRLKAICVLCTLIDVKFTKKVDFSLARASCQTCQESEQLQCLLLATKGADLSDNVWCAYVRTALAALVVCSDQLFVVCVFGAVRSRLCRWAAVW
jgi:hypothetical protein